MAVVSITVNNADVPDVLTGLEAAYKDLAQRLYFAGDLNGYTNATSMQRGQALLKAVCFDAARRVRLQRARDAVVVSDPDIT